MDRFKSPVIQTDEDALRVMIYMDLNPIRAKIVNHPRKYGYTSYHYYAYGEEDPLIDQSPAYLDMGATPEEWQKAYREMVEEILLTEGYLKRHYSSVSFIGDPEWVKDKCEKLKNYIRRNLPHQKIAITSPPI